MTLGTWALAALCAGVLGWLGPLVIARLPASPDAEADAPTYGEIAAVPQLSAWLAGGAVVLVTIVGFAVPAQLLPAWVAMCGVGIWLAYIDGRTKLLPTRVIKPLYLVALVLTAAEAWLAGHWEMLVHAVIASVGAYAVFYLFWWIAELWKGGGFGFGDVRFAGLLGLVLGPLGPWPTLVGLYLGILIGGVAGVLLKARGREQTFALGPWMLFGAVLGPVVANLF